MSVKAYISIGSNTPDRAKRMTDTIKVLKNSFDNFTCSSIYETPCYRNEGAPYYNAVASITTDYDVSLLDAYFKKIESEAGRSENPALRRVIVPMDIDLVVYDSDIIRPRDFERSYFTKGYNELINPRNILIDKFFYELPDERIALHPLAERDKCKLLVCDHHGIIADTVFSQIADYLPSETMLVYNNTRVINARLRFRKTTGSVIEIFCLEPIFPADYQVSFGSTQPVRWKCLVGNSKRWKSGQLDLNVRVNSQDIILTATRIDKLGTDSIVEFSWNDQTVSFSEIIEAAGEIPIPPYLNRSTEETDSSDYQTVYSCVEGSVAAPTAGLHFTDRLLDKLSELGIERRQVTLHVGAGTFQPVKSDSIGEHPMHAEFIDVDRDFIAELAETKRPVTAVGTTTVRTLESLYHIGCQIASGTWQNELDQWYPYNPEHPNLSVRDALFAIVKYLDERGDKRLVTATRIIIAPGYRYRIVRNLITNFHQPGSTLLLLVSAIIGETWRKVYDYALKHDYRFLSYGDACLIKIN